MPKIAHRVIVTFLFSCLIYEPAISDTVGAEHTPYNAFNTATPQLDVEALAARAWPFKSGPKKIASRIDAGLSPGLSRRALIQTAAARVITSPKPAAPNVAGPTIDSLLLTSLDVQKAFGLTVAAIVDATAAFQGINNNPSHAYDVLSFLFKRMAKWNDFTTHPDLQRLRPLLTLLLDTFREAVRGSDMHTAIQKACLSAVDTPESFELRLVVARFVKVLHEQGFQEVAFEDEFSAAQSSLRQKDATLVDFFVTRSNALLKPFYELAKEELLVLGSDMSYLEHSRFWTYTNAKISFGVNNPQRWLEYHESTAPWLKMIDLGVELDSKQIFEDYLLQTHRSLRDQIPGYADSARYFSPSATSRLPETFRLFRLNASRFGISFAKLRIRESLIQDYVSTPLIQAAEMNAARVLSPETKEQVHGQVHALGMKDTRLEESEIFRVKKWLDDVLRMGEEDQRREVLLKLTALLRRWSETRAQTLALGQAA